MSALKRIVHGNSHTSNGTHKQPVILSGADPEPREGEAKSKDLHFPAMSALKRIVLRVILSEAKDCAVSDAGIKTDPRS
jgi:hypothetical protein